MARQLSKKEEKFLNLVLEQQHFFIDLSEEQKEFLKLVKRGVCVHMTKKARKSKKFQELANLLSDMHKKGLIPSFQIVEKS